MQIDSGRSNVRNRVNPILIDNCPSLCDVLRPEGVSHLLDSAPRGNVNVLGVIAKYSHAMSALNATIVGDNIPGLTGIKLSHSAGREVETDINNAKFSGCILDIGQSRNVYFGKGNNLVIDQADCTKVV